ncbi:MAG: hypothetical protein HYV27_18430 [Candidatus Hydrogenedentes bacterium]|nr:hypothetical protein [Candidatus Hydrogenedentota bacterium]
MNDVLTKIARPLEMLLGATFLFAAAMKLLDPNLFLGQIHSYQVITSPALLGPVAIVAVATEAFLGLAMLLGMRLRGATHAATQAMLVFYTALILYAWTVHGLEDCGCFGKIKMPPSVSVLKNLVMMAVAGAAWWGLRGKDAAGQAGAFPRVPFVAALVLSLAAGGYTGTGVYSPKIAATPPAPAAPVPASPAPETPTPETPQCDPIFAAYTVTDEFGQVFDLSKGSYLVAMLSMTCDHCKESVPLLNQFVNDPDLPPLVAIAYEPEAGSKDTFFLETAPQFPMHVMGNNFLEFSKLIGQAPPRLSWVVDGCPKQSWDKEVPSRDEVLSASGAQP